MVLIADQTCAYKHLGELLHDFVWEVFSFENLVLNFSFTACWQAFLDSMGKQHPIKKENLTH